MCDFSLHAIKNRLANQGESLVVHKFQWSKGLASLADLEAVKLRGIKRLAEWLGFNVPNPALANVPAVCVPPGAKLYLEGISRYVQAKYGVGEREEVIFTQLSAEPFRYRDAVRFKNGAEALIQRFDEGTSVEVLSLETEEKAEVEELAPAPAVLIERGMAANA